MPEANKIKQEDPKVDLDTSGPEVDVVVPEEKYIGSHIKSDLAGEPVSNKSYEEYYKDLI